MPPILTTGAGGRAVTGGGGGGALGLQTNVVAMWELENTAWLDASGSGNTLTPTASPPTIVPGIAGNGANFASASSQALSVASNTGLQLGGGNFSFQVWHKYAASLGGILSKDDGGFSNREFALGSAFSSTNVYAWNLYGNGNTDHWCFSSLAVDSGVWHHIVGTWDGTTQQIFTDGSLTGTNAPGQSPVASTSSVWIGRDPNGNGYDNGTIDQVVLWKGRVLSTTDITNLYNGGAGLTWTGMA